MTIAHWDEIDTYTREVGHIRGTWADLGRGVGSVTAGVRRIQLGPGDVSTPAHVEGAAEEIFYVLGGDGLSWQDERTFEVRAGDCIVHLANAEAHTLRAGPAGLDVLAYGVRANRGGTYLPRAGVAWIQSAWVDAGAQPHPFAREAQVGPPEFPDPSPRPPTIANIADVEPRRREHGDCALEARDVARAAGSVDTGLRHLTIDPGRLGYPPHCHSAEEEIFLVLDGDGTLLLGDDEHPVRRGHVVSRPAGTGVAHAFRAGRAPLVLLAYGTRDPRDVAYYPRSRKLSFRGVGVITRVEQLDYWDGEP